MRGSLSLTAAATLQSLGVSVAPLGSAGVAADGTYPVAEFPITGGTAGPAPNIAVILHQGSGLELADASGAVDLQDFRIDTLNGVVDANVTVNGAPAGNVPVFDIGLDGTTLTLTPLAAGVLDQTLGTQAFTKDVVIGFAAPAPVTDPLAVTLTPGTHPFVGGDTTVALGSATTLLSLGIHVATLGTATLDASGAVPVVDFPITGGTAGPGTDVVVLHQGSGLALTGNNGDTLGLSDFLIDTLNHDVTANVSVNGQQTGNIPVFDLAADGATLTLTPRAAEVASYVLGAPAITPAVTIGTAAPHPDILFG